MSCCVRQRQKDNKRKVPEIRDNRHFIAHLRYIHVLVLTYDRKNCHRVKTLLLQTTCNKVSRKRFNQWKYKVKKLNFLENFRRKIYCYKTNSVKSMFPDIHENFHVIFQVKSY